MRTYLRRNGPRLALIAWFFPAAACAQPGSVPVATGPSVPQAGAQKQPIPPVADTNKAISAIHEIFGAEFAAANTPDKRAALAQQLLTQADRTEKPAERWALLTEAARLASEAGDASTAFKVIDATTAVYAVDPLAAKSEAIGKLIPKATQQTADDLTLACLDVCRTLVGKDELVEARKLLAMTNSVAKKARNRALIADINKLTAAIRDLEKGAKERVAILDKLAANPDDPAVCLDAGSYFCFKAGDWEKGLPLLAKGSDATLSRLAKDDLALAQAPDRAIAIGDSWWRWAEGQKDPFKAAGFLRASFAYGTAVGKAQGLEKVRLEKRIKAAHSDQPATGKRVALADLQESGTKNILGGMQKNGTFLAKPFTCKGQPWPKGLLAHIEDQAKGSCSITYTVPNGAKRLVGTAGIFTAGTPSAESQQPSAPQVFEILVDGRIAWKSPPLAEREQTANFDVELFGVTEVELRVSTSSSRVAWSAWLNPEIIF